MTRFTKSAIHKILFAGTLSASLILSGCGETEPQMNAGTEGPAASAPTQSAKAEMAKVPGISVQLYSVRDALKADFKGTLQQIVDMGFDGVEFAGYFGEFADDPAGLKNWLSDIGLVASGAHVPIEALMDDYENTVTFYRDLGVSVLIIPSEERAFNDQVQAFADDLTMLSEKLAKEDMKVGFHNHLEEWAPYQDTTFIEYLGNHTPKDVVLQQDVGWTIGAGKSPVEFVKAFPGRVLTTHFKSYAAEGSSLKPIIGQDDIAWPAIFTATVNDGGADWIVIEQEEYPDGLSQVEALSATKSGFDKFFPDL